jgi:spore germination protein YaaH
MKTKLISKIIILTLVFFAGFLTTKNYILPKMAGEKVSIVNIVVPKKEVMGFLPYWLISSASTDYSKYITNLTYFSLTVGPDGAIEKYTNPGETDPGYFSLTSGKADTQLASAKEHGVILSLSVFTGNDKNIAELLNDPASSAKNLVESVTPIMQEYGFTELNLDIEQASDASPEARLKFTEFVKTVKENIDRNIVKTLSIDVSASAFVKETNLADPKSFASYVDRVIVMAYDYHYGGSYVTGPVAPLSGAGTVSEFDTESAVEAALKVLPAKKIILGIPVYGYSWETIGDTPRSAVVPASGLSMSSKKVENFLATCATCSATFEEIDKENYIVYKDQETGTYHQIFYPTEKSTEYKVTLAKSNSLGGIAVWALGYEDSTILIPLSSYHN